MLSNGESYGKVLKMLNVGASREYYHIYSS